MILPISVVIPTHQRAPLLAEAIASVRAQCALPMEAIIVDDAADEATRTLVEQATTDCPFVLRYLRNPAAGVCRSRNLGAEQASQPWLAYLDDDDVWHPDFLDRLWAVREHSGVPLAIAGITRHEAGQPPKPRAQLTGLTPDTALRQPGSMTGSNFLVARDTYLEVGGFDATMTVFNDWDLFVRLLEHGTAYVVDSAPLAEWRDHGGARIATFSERRADGLNLFVARYRDRLAPALLRDFRTTALGIRRAHARGWLDRVRLTLALARAHGLRGSVRRALGRAG